MPLAPSAGAGEAIVTTVWIDGGKPERPLQTRTPKLYTLKF